MTGGSPCILTTLVSGSIKIPDFTFTVGNLAGIEHKIKRADLQDIKYGTGAECGLRNFILKDAEKYRGFFTMEQDETEVKVVLLALKNADSGVYAMTLTASLAAFPQVPAVDIKFTVTVIGCKPTTLKPSSPLKTQKWEIQLPAKDAKEADTSNLVIKTPSFKQDPECNYPVEYSAKGTKSWIVYDSTASTLTLDRLKAVNGTFELDIIG
jgi:hypothetical protein